MSEQFDKERILARVKKMMMLANDAAATEGERDNALRMAHATLAKYNLTMAQADMAGKQPEEQRADGAYTLREYAWMRGVAHSIGKLFFCSMFVTPLAKKHAIYVFVGKESNVYTALQMTQYVLNSINKEAKRQAVAAGETPMGNYWRSFCKGAAYRLHERCEQLIKDAKLEDAPAVAPGTPGTALALASVYASELTANQRYIQEQMGIKLRTGQNRQRRASMDGFVQGREYGSRIGLNKQLN